MIWTLKIKLVTGAFAREDWEGTIQIEANATLEDLHFAIQDAVDFENDHLYEFFIARTPYSRDKTRFDDENEELYTRTIESLFPLPKDRRVYYYFDYGDSWIFQVSRTRAKPFPPEPGVDYPQLMDEQGVRPDQYPDFDE